MPQGPLPITIGNAAGKGQSGSYDSQTAFSVTPRHGTYYPAASSKALFCGANPSGVTTSAALATTYVGLCLSNPAASGVNLAVKRASGLVIVAPAAFLAMGLITGFVAGGITVHTTALDANIVNSFVGNTTVARAHLDSACTLVGTPLWTRWLAVNAATAGQVQFTQDIQDDLIIPPGGYLAIGTNAAGPASGFLGSLEWEELAI